MLKKVEMEMEELEEGEIPSPPHQPETEYYEVISEEEDVRWKEVAKPRKRSNNYRRRRKALYPPKKTARDKWHDDFDMVRKRYLKRLKEQQAEKGKVESQKLSASEGNGHFPKTYPPSKFPPPEPHVPSPRKSPSHLHGNSVPEIIHLTSPPSQSMASSSLADRSPSSNSGKSVIFLDSEDDMDLEMLRASALNSQKSSTKSSADAIDAEIVENEFLLRAEALKTAIMKKSKTIKEKKNNKQSLVTSIENKKNVEANRTIPFPEESDPLVTIDKPPSEPEINPGKENQEGEGSETLDDVALRQQLLANLSAKLAASSKPSTQPELPPCPPAIPDSLKPAAPLAPLLGKTTISSPLAQLKSSSTPLPPPQPFPQSHAQSHINPLPFSNSVPQITSTLPIHPTPVPKFSSTTLQPISNLVPDPSSKLQNSLKLVTPALKPVTPPNEKPTIVKKPLPVPTLPNRTNLVETNGKMKTPAFRAPPSLPKPPTVPFKAPQSRNKKSKNEFKTNKATSLPMKTTPVSDKLPFQNAASVFGGRKTSTKSIPPSKRIVVNLGPDSSDDDDIPLKPVTKDIETGPASVAVENVVDSFLLSARRQAEAATPEAVHRHLPPSQRLEYFTLKKKLAEKENSIKMKKKCEVGGINLNKPSLDTFKTESMLPSEKRVKAVDDLDVTVPSAIKIVVPSPSKTEEVGNKQVSIPQNISAATVDGGARIASRIPTSASAANSEDEDFPSVQRPSRIITAISHDAPPSTLTSSKIITATSSTANIREKDSFSAPILSIATSAMTNIGNGAPPGAIISSRIVTMTSSMANREKDSPCVQIPFEITTATSSMTSDVDEASPSTLTSSKIITTTSSMANIREKDSLSGPTQSTITTVTSSITYNENEASPSTLTSSRVITSAFSTSNNGDGDSPSLTDLVISVPGDITTNPPSSKIVAGSIDPLTTALNKLNTLSKGKTDFSKELTVRDNARIARICQLFALKRKELLLEKKAREELMKLKLQQRFLENKIKTHAAQAQAITVKITRMMVPVKRTARTSGRSSSDSKKAKIFVDGDKRNTVECENGPNKQENESLPKLRLGEELERSNSDRIPLSGEKEITDVVPVFSVPNMFVSYQSPLVGTSASGLDPMKEMCIHDLQGSCRDPECIYQHVRY